ncbi:MAG: phosphotransferase [Pseudomonadota bacterium]
MSDFYTSTPDEQIGRLTALAQRALEEYDRAGSTIELIKARENAVFKVVDSHGVKTALRVHRAGYHSDAALRSELQWMALLGRHGVLVPEVIPTVDEQLFCILGDDEVGGARQIDLFAWVEGEQLAAIEDTSDIDVDRLVQSFSTVGEIAAKVHNHSDEWLPPEDFVRHKWDTDGFAGEVPFWGRFWDLEALNPNQRELMLRVRRTLRRELSTLSRDSAQFGMIHADLVPENVLVENGSVRLIDFDDAGFGWYMFEMATSLYFFYGEPYYIDIKNAYIEGYRRHRELTDEDLSLLPLMLLARSTTYLGWVHTRPGTETAIEMTPALIEMACAVADDFFKS